MISTFGFTSKKEEVKSITIKNDQGMHVSVLTFGAAIQSILVPDKDGNVDDVVLGFDSVSDYESDNAYIGVVVGRVAGRISGACFKSKNNSDRVHHVSKNHGDCCLHGGAKGISKSVWQIVDSKENEVTLGITSYETDDDFPGDLHVSVSYSVTNDNALLLSYSATVTDSCPINLTNHCYFNLSGVKESQLVYDHVVQINAKQTLKLDGNLMPSGEIIALSHLNDFQLPKAISQDLIKQCPGDPKGFDGYYIFDSVDDSVTEMKAKVIQPRKGRILELFTNQPGVQFYTANFLNGSQGKFQRAYEQHSAFCLEAQNYPDAMNHDNFPDIFVDPVTPYKQKTKYRFSVE